MGKKYAPVIRNICCIVFDLKKNVDVLNEVIPHGTRRVNCHLGPQHFNKCHAHN